jgi:hypothetical protein
MFENYIHRVWSNECKISEAFLFQKILENLISWRVKCEGSLHRYDYNIMVPTRSGDAAKVYRCLDDMFDRRKFTLGQDLERYVVCDQVPGMK